jgi:hypothetical protein
MRGVRGYKRIRIQLFLLGKGRRLGGVEKEAVENELRTKGLIGMMRSGKEKKIASRQRKFAETRGLAKSISKDGAWGYVSSVTWNLRGRDGGVLSVLSFEAVWSSVRVSRAPNFLLSRKRPSSMSTPV